MLAFILSNMLVQSLFAMVQYHTQTSKLRSEVLFIVTGTRPVVDAMRVLRQDWALARSDKETFSRQEYTLNSSLIEMLVVSIPTCVLIMSFIRLHAASSGLPANYFAIFPFDSHSYAILLTAFFNCNQVGYCSAAFTYEQDIDTRKRKASPKFFGAVPDTNMGRTVIFISMQTVAGCICLISCFGISLLMATGKGMFYCLAYYGVDLGLFLMLKIFRRDFWYPTRTDSIWKDVLLALFHRIFSKFVVTFTGVLHYRHSSELGGAYYLFSLLCTVCMPLWALSKFAEHRDDESLGDYAELIWRYTFWVLGVVGWFVLCLKSMNKGYARKTFMSLETGRNYDMDKFVSAEDDAERSLIFTKNMRLWSEIREDVQQWVRENWWRWEDERPAWFSDRIKGLVPPEMVPEEDDVEREKRRQRRANREERKKKKRMERRKEGGGRRSRREVAAIVEEEECQGDSDGDSGGSEEDRVSSGGRSSDTSAGESFGSK